ncbi:hypothetical protein SDC9_131161 [bioreactor metagenome]|uniref:Uncharacterized protein n=1 Tax=bioreactor metagenome TaxID=1076179 RepID=A0A645D3N8_9ZZZZ
MNSFGFSGFTNKLKPSCNVGLVIIRDLFYNCASWRRLAYFKVGSQSYRGRDGFAFNLFLKGKDCGFCSSSGCSTCCISSLEDGPVTQDHNHAGCYVFFKLFPGQPCTGNPFFRDLEMVNRIYHGRILGGFLL